MQVLTPTDFLKIECANTYGLDKLSWNDRIAWFDDITEPKDKPENPAQYYAANYQYQQAILGIPTNATVTLDATCSVIQFISVLMGDKKAASICNLIDTGSREDAYTIIHNATRLPNISRSQCKKAIMTSSYGGVTDALEIYGDALYVFYSAMKICVPSVLPYVHLLNNCWNPQATDHSWTMPDGFNVVLSSEEKITETVIFMGELLEIQHIINAPSKWYKARRLASGLVHSIDALVVREMVARCSFAGKHFKQDKAMESKLDYLAEQTGFKSARILYYRDDSSQFALPFKPFDILTVHDSFRVHVNYAQDLREQYNQLLYEIANSNLLAWIISNITNTEMPKPKKKAEWYSEILNANYAIC